jgi:hypothetical protein
MTHRSVPIANLLDAHDALVRDCAAGQMPFVEFLAAYGNFPYGYGLEQERARVDEQDVLRMFRQRIAFHRSVASLMAGFCSTAERGSLSCELAEFVPKVGVTRLRELVTRYPDMEIPGTKTQKSS